jgi:hypothetical protein
LPLCDSQDLKDRDFKAMAEITEIQQEVDFFGMDWYDPTWFAIEILDAKYEKVQIKDVVKPLEIKYPVKGRLQTSIEQVHQTV